MARQQTQHFVEVYADSLCVPVPMVPDSSHKLSQVQLLLVVKGSKGRTTTCHSSNRMLLPGTHNRAWVAHAQLPLAYHIITPAGHSAPLSPSDTTCLGLACAATSPVQSSFPPPLLLELVYTQAASQEQVKQEPAAFTPAYIACGKTAGSATSCVRPPQYA